jgi:glycosyltransferase involved in cell wall biosynthesis
VKLAFVVQRYGLEINGGAELHCRWIAEHMKKYCDVEVLTTRAFDYITWNDHYSQGEEEINGIRVKRFSVNRPRNPERFGHIQDFILENEHSEADELKWLEEEGPLCPTLIQYLRDHESVYDFFIFFSYRYYHSFWGIDAVPHKSVLVPTAEHDSIIHLKIFKDMFKKPRAFIYNSVEERELINTLSLNKEISGETVGVGIDLPCEFFPQKFREIHGIEGPYVVYIGRIDENKGCSELFNFFLRFKERTASDVKLVLVGHSKIKIPSHPDILYLGFRPEEEKFSAIKGAELLIMPSFFESLSMVMLEAWALGIPVLANARCDVLKGQCLRSNAGLFYDDEESFNQALSLMLGSAGLRKSLGENGEEFFRSNYTWDVIENKYLTLLGKIGGRTE